MVCPGACRIAGDECRIAARSGDHRAALDVVPLAGHRSVVRRRGACKGDVTASVSLDDRAAERHGYPCRYPHRRPCEVQQTAKRGVYVHQAAADYVIGKIVCEECPKVKGSDLMRRAGTNPHISAEADRSASRGANAHA